MITARLPFDFTVADMLKTKIVSSLTKVYTDSSIDALSSYKRISALKGERISFQLVTQYVKESGDELIARMPVPVRINCVLFRDYPKHQLVPYIERIQKLGRPIQFRFDYTDTTPENLYDREHDMIYQDLCGIACYTGLDGCRMRCGFHYDYNGLELTYHKTLPYSTIVEEGEDGVTYDILYDILIKQTGEIHSDWTGVKLDVEAYRKVVFEPYDLKWIERF